jgi:hypothetical protein
MLRILLFLFTLNALLLPISSYAEFTVSKSIASALTNKPISSGKTMSGMNGIKCHIPSPCINCDTGDMDIGCGLNCDTHCLSSSVTTSNTLTLSSEPTISSKIATAFKHFYLHTSSPELRPPLV